jgi:hypothetical protein
VSSARRWYKVKLDSETGMKRGTIILFYGQDLARMGAQSLWQVYTQ